MKKKINIKVVLLIQILFLAIGVFWTKIVNAGIYSDFFNLFVDLPNIICMSCFIVPGVFVMGIWKDLLKAFSVGQKRYSLIELKRIYEALKAFHNLNILGAALVVVISLIWCLQAITVDVLDVLGVCLVVCLLPIFYALVVDYLILPLIINVKREINEVMTIDEED